MPYGAAPIATSICRSYLRKGVHVRAQKCHALLGSINLGMPCWEHESDCKLHSVSNAAHLTHDPLKDKQLVWLLYVWSFQCFVFPEQRMLCVCELQRSMLLQTRAVHIRSLCNALTLPHRQPA